MGAGELNVFAAAGPTPDKNHGEPERALGTTGKADEEKAGSRKGGSMSEYDMNRQDSKNKKDRKQNKNAPQNPNVPQKNLEEKSATEKSRRKKSATKSEPATPGEKTEQQEPTKASSTTVTKLRQSSIHNQKLGVIEQP